MHKHNKVISCTKQSIICLEYRAVILKNVPSQSFSMFPHYSIHGIHFFHRNMRKIMLCLSQQILSEDTILTCSIVVMLILITCLRLCGQVFPTGVYYCFPLYQRGDNLRLYRYMVSPQTFTHLASIDDICLKLVLPVWLQNSDLKKKISFCIYQLAFHCIAN